MRISSEERALTICAACFSLRYEGETYTRHASWQKMTIDDIIILVTWLWCNKQTRNKMRNRYPISGSIATILISNFVRYVRVTKELHLWHHHSNHAIMWLGYKLQTRYLKLYMYYWLRLCQICWSDIRFEFMMSWWSRDLSTIYRPGRKWGSDFVSQVLYGILTTNFVRYVRMTKELNPCHHGAYVN